MSFNSSFGTKKRPRDNEEPISKRFRTTYLRSSGGKSKERVELRLISIRTEIISNFSLICVNFYGVPSIEFSKIASEFEETYERFAEDTAKKFSGLEVVELQLQSQFGKVFIEAGKIICEYADKMANLIQNYFSRQNIATTAEKVSLRSCLRLWGLITMLSSNYETKSQGWKPVLTQSAFKKVRLSDLVDAFGMNSDEILASVVKESDKNNPIAISSIFYREGLKQLCASSMFPHHKHVFSPVPNIEAVTPNTETNTSSNAKHAITGPSSKNGQINSRSNTQREVELLNQLNLSKRENEAMKNQILKLQQQCLCNHSVILSLKSNVEQWSTRYSLLSEKYQFIGNQLSKITSTVYSKDCFSNNPSTTLSNHTCSSFLGNNNISCCENQINWLDHRHSKVNGWNQPDINFIDVENISLGIGQNEDESNDNPLSVEALSVDQIVDMPDTILHNDNFNMPTSDDFCGY